MIKSLYTDTCKTVSRRAGVNDRAVKQGRSVSVMPLIETVTQR